MATSERQRKAFHFLQARNGRAFTTKQLVAATGYLEGTADTNLSEHWGAVVERQSGKWKTSPLFRRMTEADFLTAISQSKRAPGLLKPRVHLLLDASVIVAYYLPTATRSTKLVDRIVHIVDEVRAGRSNAMLHIPSFCIAESFSVFMKHRFSGWNSQVKTNIPDQEYLKARDGFADDIHNGKLFLQCELNRYHVLGINLVAPVDHHYQMKRPKRQKRRNRRPARPAGTFDQLIVSMGVQMARVHGSLNTVIVTADERLAMLAKKCRSSMAPGILKKLRLDECQEIVGLQYEPSTFPNVVDLARAKRRDAEDYVGLHLPK